MPPGLGQQVGRSARAHGAPGGSSRRAGTPCRPAPPPYAKIVTVMPDSRDKAPLEAFLEQYWEDREAGRVRSLVPSIPHPCGGRDGCRFGEGLAAREDEVIR